MNLTDIFHEHARACAKLGSAFTGQLLNVTGNLLAQPKTEAATLLNAWHGNARGNAGNLPLRFAGALHALVLMGKDPALTAMYPPQGTSDEALARTLERTLPDHRDHFDTWLALAPQTNEIQRSAIIIAAAHMITDHCGLPLVLSELGASGGLNLQWDRYGLRIGDETWGPDAPLFELTPEWSGPRPAHAPPRVLQRAGVDLNPLDPRHAEDYLRLQSYIWPDQDHRLNRLAQAAPLQDCVIDKEDAALWLEKQLVHRHEGQAHLIYHTVFWQYLPQETKDRLKTLITSAGAQANKDAPIYWLAFEEDYSGTSGGSIDLQIWPEGRKIPLGRADFHARWINWTDSQL